MQGTDIVLGQIKPLGLIHGGAALNTLVTLFASPEDWEMRQFVSEEQMMAYANENRLQVIYTKEN